MESGLGVPRRRKVGALFMLVGLLSATFGVFGPQASAISVPGDADGSITGFEVEGNQADDGDALDWEDLVGSDSLIVVTDDTTDTGLQGSSKENDPAGWTCNTGGANPPKNNILHAAVNTRVGPAGAFLDLAYMREGQTGNAHINFEFNQQPIGTPCPYLTRTTGDLLLLFNFPGGDGQADIAAFLWDSTIGADGEWVSTGVPANSAAAVSNGASVTDFIFPGVTSMENRQFGEASLNLAAIIGSDPENCVSFGELNVRSRSSAGNLEEDSNSINSALQDRLAPTPIDLSTCGRIELDKEDDAGNPLPGATFGLFGSESDAENETNAIDTCVTDDAGHCVFDDVNPDTYWVSEISAPAGYDEDPTVVEVTVEALTTVEIEYVFQDPRHTGFIEVTKVVTGDGAEEVDAGELEGIRFFLTTDPGDDPVNTWPPPGDTADCELDGNSFSCVIGPVVLGDYFVNEDVSTLPDGLSAGPTQSATVDDDGETVQVEYENPLNPINITLDKAGPNTANVGDVIEYTFDVTTTGEALTNVDLSEVTEGLDFADRCDTTALTGPDKTGGDQDEWLEVGETWSWTCEHTVTFAEATDNDGTQLQNKALVTAEDSFGRDVEDDDTHVVVILLPNIDLEKTAVNGTVNSGEDVEFTIVVENSGDPATVGTANDVVVTDTLFDIPGYTWLEPDGCTLDGLELTCELGDMPNASAAQIHLVAEWDGETPPEDACGVVPNHGTLTLSNGDEEDLTNNDASVNVLCPGVNLLKEADADVVEAGDDIGFTITVTNAPGGGTATNVVVTDELPGDVEWTVDDDGGADCDIDGDDLTCTIASMPEDTTVVIHVTAATDNGDCAVYDNTASATVENGTDPEDSSDSTRVRCPIEIDLDKTGDTIAHVGDTVDYQFTVTNIGGEDLINVDLTDPECNEGTIVPGDNGGDDVLAAGTWDEDSESFVGGEVWTFTCERTLTDDDVVVIDGEDFALNLGTVTAEDEDGRDTDDTDPHEVEIITPVIEIVKTVDDSTPGVGQTITFSYAVTNTGDTTLFDVVVVDDQLGDIGTIDELAPGETVVLTKEMVVAADSPTLNIATATGSDVLGKTVTDDDPETITIVLGAVIPRPLPRTGADSQLFLLLAGGFLLLGGLLVASGEGMTLRVARRRQG